MEDGADSVRCKPRYERGHLERTNERYIILTKCVASLVPNKGRRPERRVEARKYINSTTSKLKS